MMTVICSNYSNEASRLVRRTRAYLRVVAAQGRPITYRALAQALELHPPHTIHRVTEALEYLMREDAANEQPFIAAVVISRASNGLPARGFFDVARSLGHFDGDATGLDAATFYKAVFADAVAFWGKASAHDRCRQPTRANVPVE